MDSSGTPALEPPAAFGDSGNGPAPGTSQPEALNDERLSTVAAPPETAPSLEPSAQTAVQTMEAAAVTATWRSNLQVTALWSVNETRNAWMHVANVGWRKLYNGRDGAFNALVTLASQARQTGRPISFREEADGMVYEIYLW